MGAGCTKSDRPTKPGPESAVATAGEVPPAPPAPAPASSRVDRIMSVEGLVSSYDPWDAAFATLQARLGPPTRIDGTTYYWAAVTDGVCAVLQVEKIDGKDVNMAGPLLRTMDPRGLRPLRYGEADALVNRDACLQLAGHGDAAP